VPPPTSPPSCPSSRPQKLNSSPVRACSLVIRASFINIDICYLSLGVSDIFFVGVWLLSGQSVRGFFSLWLERLVQA
jgi:hypothetical protein